MNQPARGAVRSPVPREDTPAQGAAPAEAPAAKPVAGTQAAAASSMHERVSATLGRPEREGRASIHGPCLPHERDQHLEEQQSGPRANIEQAARDIEGGLIDTDLHDTPGIECVVRERYAAGNGDPDRETAKRTADEIERNRHAPSGPSRDAGERKR